MHPRSKLWHLLDFVLVRRCDLKDVLHTRVMPNAECHTDQHLVRCKLNLQFKPKPKNSGPRGKKLIVSDLRSAEVEAKFQVSTVCFTVWREPERLPQRQTTEEESSSCFHHWKLRPDLHVPTLHEDLPASHRPPQPRTGPQSPWTTTFLILVCEAQPNSL